MNFFTVFMTDYHIIKIIIVFHTDSLNYHAKNVPFWHFIILSLFLVSCFLLLPCIKCSLHVICILLFPFFPKFSLLFWLFQMVICIYTLIYTHILKIKIQDSRMKRTWISSSKVRLFQLTQYLLCLPL